ncbi:DoxX family protein [Polaribacter sp. PL03]|uniref:DoxX family protein n=1 Tax=Polaribacter sp. PL03 TaxID=3088353 RepID=UPI0029CC98A1|nr:DoxX family protein [Polaribacter sp. PL03]MDX6747814.1 DoxX family protein [Polaribacter sp. PL03]
MKTTKIIYYISTALLTVIMLFSAGMYIFNHEAVAGMFTNFGYPTYIIYPYAIAKLLGLVAVWFLSNKTIKEWAYAGFFFAFIFAFFAHVMIGDGEQGASIAAMVFLITSYVTSKKIANGRA